MPPSSPQPLRLAMPPALAAALLLLPGRTRRDVRAVIRHVGEQAERMAASLARDGALLQRTLMELQQENAALGASTSPSPPAAIRGVVERHRVPRRWLLAGLDGWNLYLVRQRPRDWTHVETMLEQAAVAPLRVVVRVLGTEEDAEGPGTEFARALGFGIGCVQLLQHTGAGLDGGRVHFPESELERFRVGLQDLADRRRTAQFHDLCWFQAKRARGHLDEAEQRLDALPGAEARACARAVIAWQRLVLERIEASEWDVLQGRSFEPGRLEAMRLAFAARRG